MKSIFKSSLFGFLSIFLFSCQYDQLDEPFEPTPENKEILTYLFLGHTYETQSTVDHRIPIFMDAKKKEVNGIDQIWLGGDICSETTKEYATLNYLDNLFDLSAPTTHWTLGNHDIRNGNLHWITEKTKRPTSYTTHFNGVTMIILDQHYIQNNIYDTTKMNQQLEMIKNVCDTIQNSSHLILLSHFVMWANVPNLANPATFANSNTSWLRVSLNPDKNFHDGIYPLLKKVKEQGIEVLNIAGDLGQEAISYEGISTDGIHFIGSGIAADTPYNEQFPTNGVPDEVLVLTHDLVTKKITWQFEVLWE